ncbi:MAG: helix-turn-helix domain-containing protein [Bacteroidales bacterium]|nr:helix-turn-helix domain-containing protein [Bacteroidales bacterium]
MNFEPYFGVAYAALLGIFFFCGLLRCCDLWKPLGMDADTLYPARRIVACVYFSVMLLLPCALHPLSPDARLLAHCFWVLFVPAATSLGYKRFFYGDRRHSLLRVVLIGGVPLVFMLALSGIALAGGDVLMPHKKAVIHAAGVLGALLTAYQLHVMIWLWHIISGADATARAADRLFPKRFASGMFSVSSSVLAATWAVFLFGSMSSNTALAGSISVVGLAIFFVILHPQRVEEQAGDEEQKIMVAVTPNGDTVRIAVSAEERPEAEAPQESIQAKEKKYTLPETQLDSMEHQIRKLVEGRRMYLNPGLKQDILEKKLGVNHSYLSEVFARRFGSFNQYLNTLRMEHAIRYTAEHPGAKQSEVVLRSGFGSDKSYYRAKAAYKAKKSPAKSRHTDNPLDSNRLYL